MSCFEAPADVSELVHGWCVAECGCVSSDGRWLLEPWSGWQISGCGCVLGTSVNRAGESIVFQTHFCREGFVWAVERRSCTDVL